ncbi:MAG: DUF1294 domain-containing protein [Marinomonas sp.]|uniref:DUF1294 domain-containing protein n=1 Tax=Marinomonas sp. GJ51-6 TaxID=2992802 RepID=UPI002934C650|nr:DUF1294 domain-containing protein [Marinomonas sp. GJ51-6]WOD08020.1 DUF1294 domain-containing protein [Marinomonas sp. GJ51-6]
MMFLTYYFIFLSVLTFFIYGIDKYAAKRGSQRISERTLHILSFLGGWLGAMFGQSVFRHKTKKRRFQVVFWLTLVANILISMLFILIL